MKRPFHALTCLGTVAHHAFELGAGVGLVMVYPNPLNPERYVLLLPEIYWGTRPLDYPDYVVLQAPKQGKGQGRILARGSFNAGWHTPK